MTDQHSDWTAYIITTLVTAVGSMIGAIVFLAKLIETKYVIEIKELKALFVNLEIKYDKKLNSQENDLTQQRIETEECLKDRQELAIKVAKLESTSNNLQKLARSSELKSMNRADLIKEQIKELEEKIENQ